MTTFWAIFNLLVLGVQSYLLAHTGYHLITWNPVTAALYLLLAVWTGRARYREGAQ